MSGISDASAVVGGVSALLGGAAGTFLIELYHQKVGKEKEQQDRTRQAEDLLVRDFITLQSYIWHKKLGECNAQLATLDGNASANLPYLPEILRQLVREALPYLHGVLALVSNATAAKPKKKAAAGDLTPTLWQLALDTALAINQSVADLRTKGEEEGLKSAIAQISEAKEKLARLMDSLAA